MMKRLKTHSESLIYYAYKRHISQKNTRISPYADMFQYLNADPRVRIIDTLVVCFSM